MNDKRKQLIKHSQKRFLERHDMNVTEADLNYMVKKIQNNQGIFIESCSNRLSKWKINFKGKICVVIYDKTHKCIVTVLPNEQ